MSPTQEQRFQALSRGDGVYFRGHDKREELK